MSLVCMYATTRKARKVRCPSHTSSIQKMNMRKQDLNWQTRQRRHHEPRQIRQTTSYLKIKSKDDERSISKPIHSFHKRSITPHKSRTNQSLSELTSISQTNYAQIEKKTRNGAQNAIKVNWKQQKCSIAILPKSSTSVFHKWLKGQTAKNRALLAIWIFLPSIYTFQKTSQYQLPLCC